MSARIIDISREPDLALSEALTVLFAGQPIALPTETVYGLAADATNPAAITRIYETKGRPRFNPLICHMADLAMAERYGTFDPVSRRLAEAFWPGPLTLVVPLKRNSGIHSLATAGLDSVGIRVPRGFAGELIRRFDRPLAAPSANTSGRISPTSARHVAEDLGDRIALILDGGAAMVGVESTIVKVEDGRLRLLRPGGIAAEEIESLTGLYLERPVTAASGETSGEDGSEADIEARIEAPGMLSSHYAPKAGVRLNVENARPGEALILFGSRDVPGADKAAAVYNLSPSGDLGEAAARLFDLLHAADACGVDTIAVAPVPTEGLGEAINDRLERAGAPRP